MFPGCRSLEISSTKPARAIGSACKGWQRLHLGPHSGGAHAAQREACLRQLKKERKRGARRGELQVCFARGGGAPPLRRRCLRRNPSLSALMLSLPFSAPPIPLRHVLLLRIPRGVLCGAQQQGSSMLQPRPTQAPKNIPPRCKFFCHDVGSLACKAPEPWSTLSMLPTTKAHWHRARRH